VKRLVIDARMLGYSGIGTYLEHLLPLVLPKLTAHDPVVVVQNAQLPGCVAAFGQHARVSTWNAQPMSSRELTLPPPGNDAVLWWAPHFNVPLRSSSKLVVTLHDLLPLRALPAGGASLSRRLMLQTWLRAIRRRDLRVLCVSEQTRTDAIELGGITAERTVVTHLAASADWRPTPHHGDAPPYIVFVGLLKTHKNVGALLRAFDVIRDRIPHRLVLIARHEGLRSIDAGALQAARAMSPRVQLYEHLSQRELVSMVSGADLLVHPSLHEGFGLTPLEAMAAGVPVIATRTGAIPEYGGDAVRFWDPAAPDQLARDIIDVLENDNERSRMRERGIALARQLTWSGCASLTCAALVAALNEAEARS